MNLTEKYNVPGPRYTSYPTVPFWDEATFTPGRWQQHLNAALASPESEDGISLYIHLRFVRRCAHFVRATSTSRSIMRWKRHTWITF